METVITIDGVTYTEGIVSGSVFISEPLCTGSVEFGKLTYARAEVSILNIPPCIGKSIEIGQREEGETLVFPRFNGVITSAKVDGSGIKSITAYDSLYAKKDLECGEFMTELLQSRTSVVLAIIRLCQFAGISQGGLPTKAIGLEPTTIEHITFEEALKHLCELIGVIPTTDLITANRIQFVTLGQQTADLTNKVNENSLYEEYTTAAIDGVQIYSKGKLIDSAGDCTNPYIIKDNPCASEGMARTIVEWMTIPAYTPARLIINEPTQAELGTMLTIGDKNVLLLEKTTAGPQLTYQSIRADGEPRRAPYVFEGLPNTTLTTDLKALKEDYSEFKTDTKQDIRDINKDIRALIKASGIVVVRNVGASSQKTATIDLTDLKLTSQPTVIVTSSNRNLCGYVDSFTVTDDMYTAVTIGAANHTSTGATGNIDLNYIIL